MKYRISIKEQAFDVEVGEISGGMARVKVNGIDYAVRVEDESEAAGPQPLMAPPLPAQTAPKAAPAISPAPPPASPAPAHPPASAQDAQIIKAPMPGLILDVKVKPGDAVTVGMVVMVMEAMKMENSITARVGGVVREVHVHKGAQVMTGAPLLTIG